jgi:hypothetical protein
MNAWVLGYLLVPDPPPSKTPCFPLLIFQRTTQHHPQSHKAPPHVQLCGVLVEREHERTQHPTLPNLVPRNRLDPRIPLDTGGPRPPRSNQRIADSVPMEVFMSAPTFFANDLKDLFEAFLQVEMILW